MSAAAFPPARLKALTQLSYQNKAYDKAIDYGKIEEASGGSARQVASIVAGISSDKAREVNKAIKELGLKGIQSQTQSDQVRVTGKKRDDLQAVIKALKERDLGIPLQFTNFRD